MEKKISYLCRTYEDYRNALIEYSKTYYPDLAQSFDDASVGSWLIDLNAAVADELSYHVDRVFQETNINSANKASSVFALARNNGVKTPGPKGAMAEVKFTCTLPLPTTYSANRNPDWSYAPIIKKGTKVASATQTFEVVEDIDFSKQFSDEGVPNRTHTPIRNASNVIIGYSVTKLGVVIAGETKIYKKGITSKDVEPFMEVLIPSSDVMGVESVITKEGMIYQSNPTMGEFYMPEEVMPEAHPTTKRFFEVDSLVQQERWGEYPNPEGKPLVYEYSNSGVPVCTVTKGEWKPVRHKFITEFTDNGYLKVIFGSGLDTIDTANISSASDFSKYQITKTMLNDSLGLLPETDTTLYILYRYGGGKTSNVALGAINRVTLLAVEFGDTSSDPSSATKRSAVKSSISVTNTIPSVSGKDKPTTEELKYIVKYNNAGKDRCVTVKDYIGRVLMMDPKYGTPFRVAGTEMNNKIMLYLLGIDYLGHLDSTLPVVMVENITNYLSNYKMVNDFVEVKSGKIINLSVEADIFVSKDYNKTDVISAVIGKIQEKFDINKRQMGDDIFVGDIEKEISSIDGVLSVIDFRVYNEYGSDRGYSDSQSTQQVYTPGICDESDAEVSVEGRNRLDLAASESLLVADGDSMFEVKYPEKDIRIRAKER